MKIIIAGNYEQFCNWCYENKINPHSREVFYTGRVMSFLGYRFKDTDELIWTGTWFERDDIMDILNEIAVRGKDVKYI